MYPRRLNLLIDELAEECQLPKLKEYVRMAWRAYFGVSGHHWDDPEGYFFDSEKYMRYHFGAGYLKVWGDLNAQLQWFDRRGDGNREVSYRLTDNGWAALDHFFEHVTDNPAPFENNKGQRILVQNLPDSIQLIDRLGEPVVKPKRKLRVLVEIDREALVDGIAWYKNSLEAVPNFIWEEEEDGNLIFNFAIDNENVAAKVMDDENNRSLYNRGFDQVRYYRETLGQLRCMYGLPRLS